MALIIPRRRSSETAAQFGRLSVQRHEVAAEGGPTYEVVTLPLPDWVVVAAVTEAGQFVLVRQHRHGIDGVTIEPAGGIIDPGEEPAESALRELREETGYDAPAVEPLGWVHPNAALQTNRCFLYLARDARELPAAERAGVHNDEHESTEAVLIARSEVEAALMDGRISHALGVLCLERALARLR